MVTQRNFENKIICFILNLSMFSNFNGKYIVHHYYTTELISVSLQNPAWQNTKYTSIFLFYNTKHAIHYNKMDDVT